MQVEYSKISELKVFFTLRQRERGVELVLIEIFMEAVIYTACCFIFKARAYHK